MSIAVDPLPLEPSDPVVPPAAPWHKSAPRTIRKTDLEDRRAWKAWRRHLRTRKPTAVERFGTGWHFPLTSGKDAGGRELAISVQQWLDDADFAAKGTVPFSRPTSGRCPRKSGQSTDFAQRGVEYAASALAWCSRLPQLAAKLRAGQWWELLDRLLRVAREADDAGALDGASAEQALVHQMLAGELALSLAGLLPEIKACRKLLPHARRALTAGLSELLDGKGLLPASSLDRLRLFLACWTRCRNIGRGLKGGCWGDEAEKRYRRFVANALRLSRRDGSAVFSDASSAKGDSPIFADHGCATNVPAVPAPAEIGTVPRNAPPGDALGYRSEADLLKEAAGLAGIVDDCRQLKPAVHSEWASLAVLRPDWSRAAPRLTVLYPGATCRIELGCGKDVLLSGTWGFDVRLGGDRLTPTSDWSELCWASDKDVDYLELEIDLGDDIRVQRHFLLARKDRFLLLADSIRGTQPASLEYRATLPMPPGVRFHAACETREGTLVGRKPRAKLLPLALPEWVADRRVGQLQTVGQCIRHTPCAAESSRHASRSAAALELRQAIEGRALFAPLFFDLDPARWNKPLTWRQLTVAESETVGPADTAVGYRVAIGKKQWLIYRSLGEARNRSLLGHNLRTEMLVARFDREGEVETLIEIE